MRCELSPPARPYTERTTEGTQEPQESRGIAETGERVYGIEANIRWKATLGAEWRQYEEIFPALNASRIGQVSLECANSHVPMSLIGLLDDKDVLLGAIDVASNRVETPEQVADLIGQATAYLAPDRILPCTNCGLAPLPRAVAIGKLRALGAGAALARLQLG